MKLQKLILSKTCALVISVYIDKKSQLISAIGQQMNNDE